ncbi:hypothetical protein [Rhodobacter lacus]|uniref:Excalibur calcium-binding domain-containing protein n=1 Tax=Rhodobacter lacus TaxID=1641972 RepID=A0ABW5A6V4_9RHOB
MRKVLVFALPVLALAACDPPVPNSAAGVGFGDYQSYLHQREAELRGGSAAPAAATPAAAPGGNYGVSGYGATPVQSAAGQAAAAQAGDGSIGAETLAALRATAPAGETNPALAAPAPGAAGVGAPLDAMAPAAGAAVTGGAGPNLAAYALSATNAPGQQVYKRGGIKLTNSARACGKFVSPDLAQMEFLRRGGPERDPGNLDPDGDGFACGWDPRPFQAARQ